MARFLPLNVSGSAALVATLALFISTARVWSAPVPSVVLDGSFGAKGALAGPGFIIPASDGRQVGGNLFQSFSQFNLNSAQSATFTATGSSGPIGNILARVTGGPSSIDGAINSDIAGANLFLLNPSGVMFGAHAQVNVKGAFVVGTPDYAKLADGGKFHTSFGKHDNLTCAPVSAFGFLSAAPATISLKGTQLNTQKTRTGLDLVGGNVTLSNASLNAPSGKISIFSAGNAGTVPFSLASPGSGFAGATNTKFGAIYIENNSQLNLTGSGGGSAVLRGGRIVFDHSTFYSNASGTASGASITVQADQLILQNQGQIITTTSGSGSAGDITVDAGSLTVQGLDSALWTMYTNVTNGAAGKIKLTVKTGAVELLTGGAILAYADNTPGGEISINAQSLYVDGLSKDPSGNTDQSKIDIENYSQLALTGSGGGSAPSGTAYGASITVADKLIVRNYGQINASTYGPASGASITVQADQMVLQNQGLINTTTSGSGSAGDITVNAGSLTVQGLDSALETMYSSVTNGATGKIKLTVNGPVELLAGGAISACADKTPGGEISINAQSLYVDGFSKDLSGHTDTSGIFSDVTTRGPDGTTIVSAGAADPLNINLSQGLTVANHSEIHVDTGSSDYGIKVKAESLDITGDSEITSVASRSSSSGQPIKAGNMVFDLSGNATFLGGATIQAGTNDANNGAATIIHAQSMLVDGGAVGGGTINPLTNEKAYFPSGILSETNSTGVPGEISITLAPTGILTMTRGGQIRADTFSENTPAANASGGIIRISAGAVDISGYAHAPNAPAGVISPAYLSNTNMPVISEISASTTSGSGGGAGLISLLVGQVNLRDGGNIITVSSTGASGTGGTINVHAQEISLSGGFVDKTSGISYPSTISSSSTGSGNAGNVTVDTQNLTLTSGAVISSSSTDSGNAGNVTINTQNLTLTSGAVITTSSTGSGNAGDVMIGTQNLTLTSGAVISSSSTLSGQAGNVTIDTQNLTLASGALITSSSKGSGDAGDVTVGTQNLTLTSGALISTTSTNSGNAGDVNVTANGLMSLAGGGGISSDTSSSGGGGNVTITAGTLALGGTGTSISCESESGATGNAGVVTVYAGSINLTNGADISASTMSQGSGGNVNISADTIHIEGAGPAHSNTGIFVASGQGALGNAGNVTVKVSGDVLMDQSSEISATSAATEAGNIMLNAANLTLQSGADINTSSAGMSGGDITLNVASLVYSLDSQITALAQGGKDSAGGNITFDPEFIVLDNSTVNANDNLGTGGRITFIADDLFNSDSQITATGATDGVVAVPAPDLNLAGSLLVLPTELVKAEKQLRERCARSLKHEFSSVIVVGRGGLETVPGELQSDFGEGLPGK